MTRTITQDEATPTRRYRTAPVGTKGRTTRDTLLDRLEHELVRTHWHEIRVAHIARDVRYSPGTFYQYFPDLLTAFDALCDRIREQGRDLPKHMELIRALLDFERNDL